MVVVFYIYIYIYIYIYNLFPAHTLQFTEHFELINILVFDYTIIVIYRTTSMSYNDTIKLFDLISKLMYTIKTCIIYGDLNLPGIDWSNGSDISLVEKYLYCHKLYYTKSFSNTVSQFSNTQIEYTRLNTK